jgi:type IV pilus assembly protein PilY1
MLLLLALATPVSALNTMIDYTSYPPTIIDPTKPNVLLVISNDQTGFNHGYNGMDDYDNSVDYWGYFDPKKDYDYGSGKFTPNGWTNVIDAETGATDHYTVLGEWSGNFLNWVTMTHADFLRKALTGGRRGTDSAATTTLLRANVPDDGHKWTKTYAGDDLDQLVPYADNSYKFVNVGTDMIVKESNDDTVDTLQVQVGSCVEGLLEPGCTIYHTGIKPEGLVQRFHDKMFFGLMTYSHEKFDRGGVLRTPIKDITVEFSQDNGSTNSSSDSLILYIEKYTKKDYDPLAEMFYDAIRYFRGNNAAQAGFCPSTAKDDDFFYFGCDSSTPWVDPVQAWCQKNNIIIINDEYPSRDGEEVPGSAFADYSDTPNGDYYVPDNVDGIGPNVDYNPDVTAITKMIGDQEGITSGAVGEVIGYDHVVDCSVKPITNLGKARGICDSEAPHAGTFYLGALAYDAFTKDMRPDFEKDVHIRTYGIAFRAAAGTYSVPPPPLNQMWLAGKYGNFDDLNGDNLPDQDAEWMKNAEDCDPDDPNDYDCLPKGFFYAEGGDKIETALVEVFKSILRRSASGTSVSVLATSGQGEGNLVQAYYRPEITVIENDGKNRDIAWTGYLQSLWVDKYGYIREDSNHDLKLNEASDIVIKYFLDTDGTTRVRRYPVTAAAPFPDLLNDSFSVAELDEVEVVWEGGKSLADTASADRNIYTSVDGVNFVALTEANETVIRPYLALQDSLEILNINDYLGLNESDRAHNLISFIRGNDPGLNPTSFIHDSDLDTDYPYVRDRVIDGKTWKLGDIINSTPVSIAAPPDRFDLIYADESYVPYYTKYKNRETMVYVGANDGMLHAFSSWQYDQTLKQFVRPDAAASTETIGSEVWAYVPQNLLPHLKWLARRDYTHVAYVDLQPRIFDARIFTDDLDTSSTSLHPNGWGTVMVVGMNTGGGFIQVAGDFDPIRDFKPSYMAFDITEPRNPKLLWEKTYEGLGFSRSVPTVMRIGLKAETGAWYLIFGNGPDSGSVGVNPNYRGENSSIAHIYIVDMLTGDPKSKSGNEWWEEDATLDSRAFFNTPIAYDRGLNYNVDAAYMGTTYDSHQSFNDTDWRGSIYRILTWDPATDAYLTDPADWTLSKVFASPRPITAPGALGIDDHGNTWAYFGTGRYFGKDSDETSKEQEYLLGFKDPLFNAEYTKAADLNKTLTFDPASAPNSDPFDLVDTTLFKVLSTGQVLWDNGSTYENPGFLIGGSEVNPWYFSNLEDYVGEHDGWIRDLSIGDTAEKSLNKPAVIGGLSLFTTFSPIGDVCDYGGTSSLWAFYYKTGTAFHKPVFKGAGNNLETVDIDSEDITVIDDKLKLGSGSTSNVGIHIGQQNDNVDEDEVLHGDMATGFVQQGTGTVVDFEFETALKIRSGLKSWRERD